MHSLSGIPKNGAPTEVLGKRDQIVTIALLALTYFLTSADRAVMPVLLEPIKADLALTDSQAGFVVGTVYGLSFCLACIPLSALADATSRNRVLAGCVFFWSIMTACSGLTKSYVGLVLARAGVGVGESAGRPISMAIIASMFPEDRRATALSICYGGLALGTAAAFISGSQLVSAGYDWRMVFILFGVPGILLAPLLLMLVREPKSARAAPVITTAHLGRVFRLMLARRSLRRLALGFSCVEFVIYGFVAFMMSILMRSYALSIKEAGLYVAVGMAGLSAIGTAFAGWIVDRVSRDDPRWRARMCALFCVISIAALLISFWVPNPVLLGLFLGIYMATFAMFTAPSMALMMNLVEPDMRATAGAGIVLLAAATAAIGPWAVGAISDFLTPTFGQDSLKYAIVAVAPVELLGAALFLSANSSLVEDLGEVRG